jgi:manganese/zinc/iron transport system permease protein
MRAWSTWTWEVDGWIVLTGMLCAIAAALLGNFLVLRRLSLLGDAITHAILPGLAVAFLVSDNRSGVAMFVGAVIAGILTTVFTEWIHGLGRVDEGASMGVVFTTLFALGLILIVQAADRVDLDPDCVLYGAIELTPIDTVLLGGFEIPRAVVMLGGVAILNAVFVFLFYKELKVSSFDPVLATTLGIPSRALHYALMVLVAVTAVASFESVGNILVVAMFVVPPATALLLTSRLTVVIPLGLVIGCASVLLGHVTAIEVPGWFGLRSTTTAGMIAVAAGAIFTLAVLFSPRQGLIPQFIRQRRLAWSILFDDIVALLYRIEERGGDTPATAATLASILFAGPWSIGVALRRLTWAGDITVISREYRLTAKGKQRGQQLVRSHRLWENYLVSRLGVPTERIHNTAEQLEHYTDPKMRAQLDSETDSRPLDPHGREIPTETPSS